MPLCAGEAFGELLELGCELVADGVLRMLERRLDAGEELGGRSADEIGNTVRAFAGRGISAGKGRDEGLCVRLRPARCGRDFGFEIDELLRGPMFFHGGRE